MPGAARVVTRRPAGPRGSRTSAGRVSSGRTGAAVDSVAEEARDAAALHQVDGLAPGARPVRRRVRAAGLARGARDAVAVVAVVAAAGRAVEERAGHGATDAGRGDGGVLG